MLEERVLERLRELAVRWRVKYIVLFGSRVRGRATPLSDWDIAVKFGREITSREYIMFLGELVDILDSDKVDLIVLDHDIPVELAYEILWKGEPIVVINKDELVEDRLKVFRDLNDLKIKQSIRY